MENQTNKRGAIVAIITMVFLFAMIAFVTNMAAPFGTIWKEHYEWAGMMGNMMNFAAYLFMGIPAGMMITKYGCPIIMFFPNCSKWRSHIGDKCNHCK